MTENSLRSDTEIADFCFWYILIELVNIEEVLSILLFELNSLFTFTYSENF